MIQYSKDNVNFKNKKTTDCVVRALANASGKDYKVVAQELVDIWLKTGYHICDKHCYEKWLEQNGFIKVKQPKKENGKKYLIIELDELISKDDSVVISCANHLTSAINNTLVDIWDCRYKTVGNYYVKKGVKHTKKVRIEL